MGFETWEGACPSVFAITPCHDTVARQTKQEETKKEPVYFIDFSIASRLHRSSLVALLMKLGRVVLEDQEPWKCKRKEEALFYCILCPFFLSFRPEDFLDRS